MTGDDRAQWVALRRSTEAGEIGGPDDGAGTQAASLTLWQVEVTCEHGSVGFAVEIGGYLELLAAFNVLGLRHAQEFACACVAQDDRAIVRRALDAWRAEYGRDPVIE
jgi:hypothetical protein